MVAYKSITIRLGYTDRSFAGVPNPPLIPSAGDDVMKAAAVDEAVHLRAAGDGAPRSLIRPPAFFLPPSLRGPRLPIVGDRLRGQYGRVFHDLFFLHVDTLSGSSRFIQHSTLRDKYRKVFISGQFYDFVFRPDGKILAPTGYGMIFLDPETGRQIKRG